MQFTIGQRVRIVAPGNLYGTQGTIYDIHRMPGFISRLFGERAPCWSAAALAKCVHPKETAYKVDIDGVGRYSDFFGGVFGFPSYWLRPLEDPKADEFIASIKKLKPYEEPKRETTKRERVFDLKRDRSYPV